MSSHIRANQNCGDGNRSSVSSEGFCENDDDILNDSLIGLPGMSGNVDTDSQEGGGSDTNSSSGGANLEGNSSSGNRSGESSQESSDSMKKSKNYKLIKNIKLYNDSSGIKMSMENNQHNNIQQCMTNSPSTTCDIEDHNLLRRSSKDESVSSSESQQSGDECNVYYYDQKQSHNESNTEKYIVDKDKPIYAWIGNYDNDKGIIQCGLKLPSDAWEVLFARAEGLYAHGHSSEARRLGVRLTRELLQRPPDLAGYLREPFSNIAARRKGRRHHHISLNPPSHRLSLLASATLARCAFLCTVSFFFIYWKIFEYI